MQLTRGILRHLRRAFREAWLRVFSAPKQSLVIEPVEIHARPVVERVVEFIEILPKMTTRRIPLFGDLCQAVSCLFLSLVSQMEVSYV